LYRQVSSEVHLDQLVETYFPDLDIVLTEGYKREDKPKIEVTRTEPHEELLCTKEDNLVAVVSDKEFALDTPCFNPNDYKGIADFLEKNFIKKDEVEYVELFVDGREIPLTAFVKSFISKTIFGMISSLRGAGEARDVVIKIYGGRR
jgi:hypothetical protein